MKKPLLEIITIGNEIIAGDILNENARFMAKELSKIGLFTERITSIGDEPKKIASLFKEVIKRTDTFIVSGGLGPTMDDRTIESLSIAFEIPLETHPEILRNLKKFTEKRGRRFTKEIQKMALLPKGAVPFYPEAHISGFYLEICGKLSIFLPGVPHELRNIFQNKIKKLLLDRFGTERPFPITRVLRIFGPFETDIQRISRDIPAKFPMIKVGYYPRFPEHHLILTVMSNDLKDNCLDEAEHIISSRLGKAVYGKDEESMEKVVGRLLTEEGLSLSLAESCTGGLISERITSIPGSSNYFQMGLVVYSNRAKIDLLGVKEKTLNMYGAVSKETAYEMARGLRARSSTDIALSVTGIAGPSGGTPEKPVGTVFFGIDTIKGTKVRGYRFTGNRHQIQLMSSQVGLDWIRRFIIDDTFIYSH